MNNFKKYKKIKDSPPITIIFHPNIILHDGEDV